MAFPFAARLLVVVTVLLASHPVSGVEPTYQGKPITYWMDGFCRPTAVSERLGRPMPEHVAAIQAVQALGFKAVPYMLTFDHTNATMTGSPDYHGAWEATSMACYWLSTEDKQHVLASLPGWMQSTNSITKACAVVLAVSSRSPELTQLVHEMRKNNQDNLVQQAMDSRGFNWFRTRKQ